MTSPSSSSAPRTFTVRSVFFAGLGIVIMSGLSGFHDWVLRGSPMVGNQLPVGAFAYFMLLGIFWNGLWSLLDAGLARLRGKAVGAESPLADRFALSSREMALVMLATLIACFPPTSGLFRYFQRQLMLPWHYLTSKLEWIKYGLLTTGWPGQVYDFHLHQELFPAPWPGADPAILQSIDYGTVYNGFFTGLAKSGTTVPLSELPLAAWIGPMLHWIPLLLLLVLALLALQFLVHRQWAHHEQLSYPVAQVAGAFCARKDGRRGVPDVFRNRLFWCGFVPVFILLGLDYLATWYPEDVPGLRTMMPNLRSWWVPITTELPFLKKAFSGGYFINGQTLYFTFLGISYFVSSEISLSVGVSPVLLIGFSLLYYSTTGSVMGGQTLDATRCGAFLGYTVILLYTGRTYFKAVFGRALLPRRGTFAKPAPRSLVGAGVGALLLAAVALWLATRPDLGAHRPLFLFAYAVTAVCLWTTLFGGLFKPQEREAAAADAGSESAADAAAAANLAAPDEVSVLAARILVMAFAGFVVVLSWMCQSWLVALFYGLLVMILFLVISRIVCETGIPFVQAGWLPHDLLLNIFGSAALGPQATNFTTWGSSIMAQDPREALMPFLATGTKVAEGAGIPMRKVLRAAVVAVVAALAVAWAGSMFSLYNYNPMSDSWAASYTPKMYFDQTAQQLSTIEASGMLEESLNRASDGSFASAVLAPLRRLGLAQPNSHRCHYVIYGALAVILLSFLRFRFSKFPLHPVIYLIAGTWPFSGAWGSFLLGWFIKQAVVRFGGGGVYQRLKPLFIGIICGEVGMAGTALLVEFAHYGIYHAPAHVVGWFLPG